MRWWEEVFNETERATYQAISARRPQARGRRPALLVVDVVRAFCGRRGQSLEEALREWPTACGPQAWEAVEGIEELLQAARRGAAPVIYIVALQGSDHIYGGTVRGEVEAMGAPMSRPGARDIPQEIAPRPGEVVLAKTKPSAFFGTPLVTLLNRAQVDSLIVCGCTTSGCVRATVVDGFSYGYRVFVPEEAVFDRARLSQAVGLFEMNSRYAQVVSVREVLTWLEGGDREREGVEARGQESMGAGERGAGGSKP